MYKPLILIARLLVVACLASCAATDSQQSGGGAVDGIAGAQEIPRGLPEDVGLLPAGLLRMDELIESYIDEGRVPGVVVGIAKQGRVVYLRAHGMLEPSTGTPMPEDAIFIMASSAKPVTGVAALILVDEGLIRLDDPVSKYIPEYQGLQFVVPVETSGENKKTGNQKKAGNRKSAGKREIPDYRLEPVIEPLTIHHLLTHTAGVGTQRGLGAVISKDRAGPSDTLATWVPRMAKRPLDFEPGTHRAYSPGSGLKIVGRVIEIVSGMPLTEFIQARILDPLDMTDSYFDVPEDELYRMPSRFHDKARGTGQLVGPDGSAFVSGGGLFSTTRDYLRFQQMLLNGGSLYGQRILEPETVQLMTTNRIGDLSLTAAKGGLGTGHGYTTSVSLDQEKAWSGRINGSYGWGGAGGTVSWSTPSKDLTVVYMVQQPSDLPRKITPLIQDALID